MGNIEKIKWKPRQKPMETEIEDFVRKTLGGNGFQGDDGNFLLNEDNDTRRRDEKPNQVHPAECKSHVATGIWSGKFYWKNGAGDAVEPSSYVIAETGSQATNIHLLRCVSPTMSRTETESQGSCACVFVLCRKWFTSGNSFGVHRFFALYAWGLKRPEIIISVTGGAANFDLNSDEKDKILKVATPPLLETLNPLPPSPQTLILFATPRLICAHPS